MDGLLYGLPLTFLKEKMNKVDIIWSLNVVVILGGRKLWVHDLFDELTT
jgi:hypothetical protein